MTRRLLGLLACLAAGVLIGALVQLLAGRAEGWLAIPLLLAAGWLVVADPTQCEPRHDRPEKGRG